MLPLAPKQPSTTAFFVFCNAWNYVACRSFATRVGSRLLCRVGYLFCRNTGFLAFLGGMDQHVYERSRLGASGCIEFV
jgi:hypothetical protein